MPFVAIPAYKFNYVTNYIKRTIALALHKSLNNFHVDLPENWQFVNNLLQVASY